MAEPYRESEDHVPDPTHVVAQLDTTGLGGTDTLHHVTPIFARTAEMDVLDASDALKLDDPRTPARVILPEDREDARLATERLHARAETIRAGSGGAETYDADLGDDFERTKHLPEWEAEHQVDLTGASPAVVQAAQSGESPEESSARADRAGPTAGPATSVSEADIAGDDDTGNPEADTGATTESAESAPERTSDFDPTDKSVPAVKAYLDGADDTEIARVKAAEQAGHNRKGIMEYQPTN